jgi:hypothetical protein
MATQDVEVVPFETIKEDWSIYRLKDGSTIKVRYILIKVLKHAQLDVYGKPVYDLNYGTIAGVILNKNLLGSPSPPSPPDVLAKSIVENDIEFETAAEPWNEYRVEGKRLRVKLVLTKVSRTSIFDQRGEPAYLMNTQPIVTGEG